ncbi:MAG: carboxypeptidase-like regulatory domain-containing protein [Bacteroidetes bacterium]|nr:MAG: carboxypeptidase-like regulatory domain-containing protein [Bacteroidota bacterium]MBL1145929.1 carboxypeptidase-like regulatory domain-containing protein [Bacteroidota bacterium]NOG58723.1 carboxypeptidase-like regulatory domain-containing protein [Bacteroidota bacterium]
MNLILRNNKNLILFVCMLFCSPALLLAQKTIVRGKITDASTGETLPFVNLIFKDSKVGASSDINGNFLIETYYATDSLIASYLGYKSKAMRVKQDIDQTINFKLQSGGVDLEEVVIKYKGNPAHAILARVKRNKAANNREKYDSYGYEVYNKVEFDINNITEEFKNKKVFKNFQFIFDYTDTTGGKEYLPMFMTESLSDLYYRRNPKSEKEYIKAVQVSGTSNESITQFMGDMYQKVNVYENYIDVFGKSFVSPIADFGLIYYRYYLKDSVIIDGSYCYEIDFVPKLPQEPVFSGTMWINDTTYAIKRIEANIAKQANINFVNGFEVKQEYTQVDGKYWMLKKDELIVDFQIGEKVMGLYGRKATSYKNIKVNKDFPDSLYQGIDNVVVLKNANKKNHDYWVNVRHDSLTANQKGIYEMIDSVKNVPAFKTFVDIIKLVFTGYKEFGKIEIGPYFKLYSYNQVEGHRLRFGGRTSNEFSTNLQLNAYAAYGFKDKRFKYSGGFQYKINQNPRRFVEAQYTRDVEQLGLSQNAFSQDNILSSFLRRNPNNKLTDVEEYKVTYEQEWITGLSSKFFFKRRGMMPLGSLNYKSFIPDPEIGFIDVPKLTTTELSLYTRFAHKEKFVEGEFERISLGSKYPILELQVGFGVKDFFGSDYNYQKFELAISDIVKVGIYGKTEFRTTAGKYLGTLPYALLEIHNGNESYFYDKQSFNLMNYFEFISDEYATLMLTHHFDGFFLNKMPLLRKLKWREVASFRTVAGRLQDKHRKELVFPSNIFELHQPYMEAGIGIENIFKLIRIDAMWRLNYLDHPDIAKFGIRASFEFSF